MDPLAPSPLPSPGVFDLYMLWRFCVLCGRLAGVFLFLIHGGKELHIFNQMSFLDFPEKTCSSIPKSLKDRRKKWFHEI